ncbi:MAG: hypothetical protein RSD98_10470 [Niameybacter sp.]
MTAKSSCTKYSVQDCCGKCGTYCCALCPTSVCNCTPCGKSGLITALKWLDHHNIEVTVHDLNQSTEGSINTVGEYIVELQISDNVKENISLCALTRITFSTTIPVVDTLLVPPYPLCSVDATQCNCDEAIRKLFDPPILPPPPAPKSLFLKNNNNSSISIVQVVKVCSDLVWIRTNPTNQAVGDYEVIPYDSIFRLVY